MNVGDHVTWHGRCYRIVGFDPMSVPERLVHLEDTTTRERVSLPVAEVERAAPCASG